MAFIKLFINDENPPTLIIGDFAGVENKFDYNINDVENLENTLDLFDIGNSVSSYTVPVVNTYSSNNSLSKRTKSRTKFMTLDQQDI